MLGSILLLKMKQFLLNLVAASCFCPPDRHNDNRSECSASGGSSAQTRGASTKHILAAPRLLCPAWMFHLLNPVDEAVDEPPDVEVCNLDLSDKAVSRREERREFGLWSLLSRVLDSFVMTGVLTEYLSLRRRVGPASCTTAALQKGDRQRPE